MTKSKIPPGKGSRHHGAKLTEKIVLKIRKEYAKGKISYVSLASKYGISYGIIGMVVRRERWKHV